MLYLKNFLRSKLARSVIFNEYMYISIWIKQVFHWKWNRNVEEIKWNFTDGERYDLCVFSLATRVSPLEDSLSNDLAVDEVSNANESSVVLLRGSRFQIRYNKVRLIEDG